MIDAVAAGPADREFDDRVEFSRPGGIETLTYRHENLRQSGRRAGGLR